MRPKIKGEYFDPTFLFRAFFAWFLSALLLLIIASIILKECEASERVMAYASSTISFIAALVAGVSAKKKGRAGSIYTSLLTASALVTALFTIGFLIDGSNIVPSSVMSVISFTFSGCLVGTVLVSLPDNKKKQYKPRI